MVTIHPSAGNTLTLRVSLQRVPGTLGRLTSALGAAGALVDAIDIIDHQGDVIIRQIQVETRGEAHGREVVEAARAVPGVELLSVTDRVFDRHRRGKIEVTPKFPVLTRDDLSMAYTPGVGRVCTAIAEEPERRLQDELDIPIFHDDQHGTAVVSLAALYGAAEVVGKRLQDLKVVCLGLGAAGVACVKLWQEAGVGHFIGVDRRGIVSRDRKDLNAEKRSIAETTNPEGVRGGLEEALAGADVFIGVSGPGLVKSEWVGAMAKDAIVFAMANPIPEIMPEEMPDNVAVVATGRSDYANQINNVLVFPGMFRGLLDGRARSVDMSMKVAAARAIADIVTEDGVSADHIVPSIFDARVVPAVSNKVQEAAAAAGLGTRPKPAKTAVL